MFQTSPTPHIACHVANQEFVAKLAPRVHFGLVWTLASLNPILDRHAEVSANLVRKLFVLL